MADTEARIFDPQGLRILIIEDNDTDFLLLQRHIKKLWPASSCDRAAQRAEVFAMLLQPWNLIITDYHLLDIEGDELLNTIANNQPQAPCLILSGSIEELRDINGPANVFCRLEKGDYAGLSKALSGNWREHNAS